MKKILVMAAAMLFSLQGIHAQTDVTEETDSDDIITVTDKDGKQEEIEVPEEWKITLTACSTFTMHRLT